MGTVQGMGIVQGMCMCTTVRRGCTSSHLTLTLTLTRETKPPGEKMVGFFRLCVIAYAGAKWWVDPTLPLPLPLPPLTLHFPLPLVTLTLTLTLNPNSDP